MEQTLCAALQSKIDEQMERTDHLLELLGPHQLEYRLPLSGAWTISESLGHLLDCMAGFCAALHAADPDGMKGLGELRGLPVNHRCGRAEAREGIAQYRHAIATGLGRLPDGDLYRQIPTVFVPEGESLLTLLLGNLEHLTNHKYQLFLTMKMAGVPLTSSDVYCFRGSK